MLPGLQFTDFHKFLVSVGGLACAAGFALPIFLLRTQKTISVTEQQLAEFSEPAQRATAVQQEQLFWLLRVWPWVSSILLVGGLILIVVGAIMWRSRQEVLNSKEAAEIRKIDAEREKAFHEGVALAKKNLETPEQTEAAFEEKVTESAGGLQEVELVDSSGVADSLQVSIDQPSDKPLEEVALKRVLAELTHLPNSMRTGVQTLASLELVAELMERSAPDGSKLLRNLRAGQGERADLFLLLRDEFAPSIAIDVKFVINSKYLGRAVEASRIWSTNISLDLPGAKDKRVRPVAFVVVDSEPAQSKIEAATKRFMDPAEPGAALFVYSFSSLIEARRLDLSGSAFTSESSTVYVQF